MAEHSPSGMIIRGRDGALYFIGEDVLQTCKVTQPEKVQFYEQLLEEADDTQGFGVISSGRMLHLISPGPFNPPPVTLEGRRYDRTLEPDEGAPGPR
ncbi:MAG: hypothetical protein ACREMB_08240 [Candidatus Rokuibacteriota bacterium]